LIFDICVKTLVKKGLLHAMAHKASNFFLE
jgi:hypothetical protein